MFQVYVNDTSIGKFCNNQPASKMVSALGFDVHFHSDAYSNDVGFVASYFITDGRVFPYYIKIALLYFDLMYLLNKMSQQMLFSFYHIPRHLSK